MQKLLLCTWPSLARHQAITAQLLRVMKLTTILLTAAFLNVYATGNSQLVTFSGENVSLEKVFKAVKKQTGYVFFYNAELLEEAKPVNVKAKDVPLDEFLSLIFSDQPFDFEIRSKSISVSKKIAEVSSRNSLRDKINEVSGPVKGRVVNEKGEPVEGVSVTVKGSNVGTSTNANGEFYLEDIDENATLVFTHTSIEKMEQKRSGRSELTVGVKVKSSILDEVQVIPYGTQIKRFSVGNVTTVKGEDIAKQPVNNPLLALAGRVPGLFIEQATGVPGSTVRVRIQGQNSLSKGSEPLYVIDGVPFISQLPVRLSQIQTGDLDGGVSPFSFLNPGDIESIEVLKDADATSIYGSRAAAGAILISTKKGKAGRTKVDLNLQQGWSKVGKFVDLLNTQQYLEMRNEAMKNDNVTPGPVDYDLNGAWDTTRYTDWQKELIGGTAKYTDLQLSLSGGTTTSTFLLNSAFHRETTVFPGSNDNRNGSFHLNTGHRSLDQRLHASLDVMYTVNVINLQNDDLTPLALQLPPIAPALYTNDGKLNWAPDEFGNSSWHNPLSYLESKFKNRVNNLLSSLEVGYEIFRGVELKVDMGYTDLTSRQSHLSPLNIYAPEQRSFFQRQGLFSNSQITSWNIEPQAVLKRNIGNGKVEAIVGTTFLKTQFNDESVEASGFTTDLLMENPSAAPNIILYNGATTYKYNAAFGRINYNWKNRYLITANVRRDGSSRFGSENLFNSFWSAGGAWLFSEEAFIKNNLRFLSFGKMRLSYGTSGNDQIGEYQFMNLYFPTNTAIPYQGTTGLQTNNYHNPYLQWEETRKLQGGLNIGFLGDRILIDAGFYRNRSSNQLQWYNLPLFTGVGFISANFPATIQNSGFEFQLETVNMQGKNFSFSSSINLTIPKNKLVAYKDLQKSTYRNSYVIGQPFTILKLYRFAGVDPTSGFYIFTDSKGNVTSDPVSPEDRVVLVNTSPKYFGGLRNSFHFKSFSIDFLFQFVKQVGQNNRFNSAIGIFYSDAYSTQGNQPAWVLNRWQKPGDNTSMQRLYATYRADGINAADNAKRSDAMYSDASYIRLKNLSLSWQAPGNLLRKIRVQNLRFYAQGQNLLTFTRYKGLDPETKTFAAIPPLRVLTIGMQTTF